MVKQLVQGHPMHLSKAELIPELRLGTMITLHNTVTYFFYVKSVNLINVRRTCSFLNSTFE